MSKSGLLSLILAGALVQASVASACTAVDVQAKDGTVVASRTMEWFFDMQWQVVSMPQGTDYTMTAPASVATRSSFGLATTMLPPLSTKKPPLPCWSPSAWAS